MRVRLGPAESFSEGKLTVVDLRTDDRVLDEAVVWRWGDQLYAVRNFCSHQGAPLGKGRLVPKVTADREGGRPRAGEVPVIRCPWHRWEFDPSTGCSIADASLKVKTWPVVVEDGDAFLELKSTKRANVTAVVKTDAFEEGERS